MLAVKEYKISIPDNFIKSIEGVNAKASRAFENLELADGLGFSPESIVSFQDRLSAQSERAKRMSEAMGPGLKDHLNTAANLGKAMQGATIPTPCIPIISMKPISYLSFKKTAKRRPGRPSYEVYDRPFVEEGVEMYLAGKVKSARAAARKLLDAYGWQIRIDESASCLFGSDYDSIQDRIRKLIGVELRNVEY
ncbi:hypothetical protein A9Q96_14965 [Rhodobacterales bacterium 52_120_T64]|nr:hypothetical protein A9Q96_14965 [Rhodobacterales bacterium 52_120_T64]